METTTRTAEDIARDLIDVNAELTTITRERAEHVEALKAIEERYKKTRSRFSALYGEFGEITGGDF